MDVTSSCKSRMNTGVQRVVRGFFRGLRRAGHALRPLVWDPTLGSYCDLSRRELAFLERPFGETRAALAEPGRQANPVPLWSKFSRTRSRRKLRCDVVRQMTARDLFFVPEIFQDNRIEWLAETRGAFPARRLAMFYDAIVWRRPELASPKRRARFEDYLRALGSFDEVWAISREVADDLQDFGGITARVCGLPVDDFLDAPVRLTTDKIPSVLCVGTFEARKNHLRLIEAAEKIWREHGPIFELKLIGRTTQDFGQQVIDRIKRNALITWERHVDDETLRAAYDACVFTVFPSLVEGFGLPIIESLRRGRPCLCGGNGSLGELARRGGCLIVDQTDVAELAAAILRLLRDDNLRAQLSAAARARVFENWDEFLQRQREIFTSEEALAVA